MGKSFTVYDLKVIRLWISEQGAFHEAAALQTIQIVLAISSLGSRETYQWDLLEASLELVQDVERRLEPIMYKRLASWTSAIGFSVKFSTSMYPFEPV